MQMRMIWFVGIFLFLVSNMFCLLQVRRLKEFGVTKGELARYLDALLKDSEQLAAMIDNVSSVDNLDFIMESDALGHMVMDQRQGHESLVAVAGTVTLEEVISLFFFFFDRQIQSKLKNTKTGGAPYVYNNMQKGPKQGCKRKKKPREIYG